MENTTEPGGPRRRTPFVLFVVLVLTVGMALYLWRRESMGRPLTDDQIAERLVAEAPPADIQHALAQLEDRLGPAYPDRERFRPLVTSLVDHPLMEVRRQVAWVMGREPADAYREALVRLLADEDPGVRVNAACSLSNFNDPRARPSLLAALEPLPVLAPATGKFKLSLTKDAPASLGTALGHIEPLEGDRVDIRPPLNGFVADLPLGREGDVVEGQLLVLLAPDPKLVHNVVVALRFVGKEEDREILRPYAEGFAPHSNKDVEQAARRTMDALSRR
jgi:hypothetical protein